MHIVRKGDARVCELVHSCKFLSIHCHCRFLVGFPWSWLIHHFGHFGADCESKVCTGRGSKRNSLSTACLQHCTSAEVTVVGEQEVSKLVNTNLGFGLEMTQVEKLSICSVSGTNPWVVVLKSICQHRCKPDEQCCG